MTHSDDRPVIGGIELGRIFAGRTHAPVVYFARAGDNVKIGTSTQLKTRLQAFYLTLDDVLIVIPGGRDVETACHKRFAESRIAGPGRRELFRLSGKLSIFLASVRADAADADPEDAASVVSLRRACADRVLNCSLDAARKAAQRPGFPQIAGWDGPSALYYRTELNEWQIGRVKAAR